MSMYWGGRDNWSRGRGFIYLYFSLGENVRPDLVVACMISCRDQEHILEKEAPVLISLKGQSTLGGKRQDNV